MQFKFKDKSLQKLYVSHKSKYSDVIMKAFFKKVMVIKRAEDIRDLHQSWGNHFEKLKGRKNDYSIRLNKQYRLEFELLQHNLNKIVLIKKISKHYE